MRERAKAGTPDPGEEKVVALDTRSNQFLSRQDCKKIPRRNLIPSSGLEGPRKTVHLRSEEISVRKRVKRPSRSCVERLCRYTNSCQRVTAQITEKNWDEAL